MTKLNQTNTKTNGQTNPIKTFVLRVEPPFTTLFIHTRCSCKFIAKIFALEYWWLNIYWRIFDLTWNIGYTFWPSQRITKVILASFTYLISLHFAYFRVFRAFCLAKYLLFSLCLTIFHYLFLVVLTTSLDDLMQ